MHYILGIETSCDETAASVVWKGKKVLSNIVSSQISKHAKYGGVVPELAAREHLEAIDHVVRQALESANLAVNDMDAVAVTNGPGLIPSLLIGLNFARGLATSHELPLIGVNHFMAHIYGAFIENNTDELEDKGNFPLLALVVSGGHTAILLVEDDGSAKSIGTTLDDAAGEALDKAAKLLGLGYPGGPIIEKTALKGNPAKFAFPRSLTGRSGKALEIRNRFNFSFSGVKTALYYHCKKITENGTMKDELLYDTVASYQEAVIDVLARKTFDAIDVYKAKTLVLCGGVACNSLLRSRLKENIRPGMKFFAAEPKFCTDNAAMVAGMGYKLFLKGQKDNIGLDAFSRLPPFEKIPFI